MKKILVTGAMGQIGSELTQALRARFGNDNVFAVDKNPASSESSPCCCLDILDRPSLEQIVASRHIDTIFHLAALLSAVGEQNPQLAWDINMNGLINVLETARQYRCAVFFPSSIAAFGTETPAMDTPQDTIQRPTTMYGITKVSGELLCDYYYRRYDVDARGLRYPGIVSSKTQPGGGTTDYAVDIFRAALQTRHYDCFLGPDTQLDMMYMPDALDAAITLMTTDAAQLKHRNAFNVTAMSFTPRQLAEEIQRHIPDFTIAYRIDPLRQAIADSWPRHMNDSAARCEWGWQAQFDLPAMVKDMLDQMGKVFRSR